MFVTLDIAKQYLRVDSADDDALIAFMLPGAEQRCIDIARLTPEEVAELGKVDLDDDGNVISVRTDAFDTGEVIQIRETMRIAVLYALTYMYEHREDSDQHELNVTLRSLLCAVRERRLF